MTKAVDERKRKPLLIRCMESTSNSDLKVQECIICTNYERRTIRDYCTQCETKMSSGTHLHQINEIARIEVKLKKWLTFLTSPPPEEQNLL